jgi:hypothetical protein
LLFFHETYQTTISQNSFFCIKEVMLRKVAFATLAYGIFEKKKTSTKSTQISIKRTGMWKFSL